MVKVKKIKQIVATTRNKVGQLEEVSSAIKETGANINAICAYAMESKAYFMIATDNNAKALPALKNKGCDVKEEEVVEIGLENKIGALSEMAKKLASAEVDLNYVYGSVGEGSGPCRLIFSSNNDDKAIDLLK